MSWPCQLQEPLDGGSHFGVSRCHCFLFTNVTCQQALLVTHCPAFAQEKLQQTMLEAVNDRTVMVLSSELPWPESGYSSCASCSAAFKAINQT